MNSIYKLYSLVTFALSCLIIPITNAETVVIDFDNAVQGSFLTENYFEDGFKMELTSGHYDIGEDLLPSRFPPPPFPKPFSGNFLGLDRAEESSTVRFTHINGQKFDFISVGNLFFTGQQDFLDKTENVYPFDFVPSNPPEVGSFENNMIIQSSAGGLINTFYVDENIYSFNGPQWSNLSWLSFTSNESIAGIGIDSVTLKTVPIPTAIWLFGSSFLGLIRLTMKRKIN